MVKYYKKSLILSSLVILLPAIVGMLLWEQLPSLLPTHWGFDGQADGWQSKAVGIILLPLVLLAAHWFCLFFTWRDPGNKGRNRKVFQLVMWIMPVVSLYCNTIMYSAAFGYSMNLNMVSTIPLGLMFIIIGNYLPKCQQNHTIGIKIPWTLANEENWNKTHRFGGRCWVTGGIALTLCAFLPGTIGIWVMVTAIFVLALLPMAYSYKIYRDHKRQGIVYPKAAVFGDPRAGKLSAVFLVLLLFFLFVVMFTGNISYVFEEDSFTIEADFWTDMAISYDTIDQIVLNPGNVPGTRISGFGSARLLLGAFQNEEFGPYTRYTYTNPESCVILTSGQKVLVLSGKNTAETEALYQQISQKLQ